MGWIWSDLRRRTEEQRLAVEAMRCSSSEVSPRSPPPLCREANPASLERARERCEGRRAGPKWRTREER